MLDDSGRIKDKVKISELPPHEQLSFQVNVLHQVTMNLLKHLKKPLLEHIANLEVGRDRDVTQISLPTQETIPGLFPSPKEVRDMISPQNYWFLDSFSTPSDHATDRQIREAVKTFLGASDKIIG